MVADVPRQSLSIQRQGSQVSDDIRVALYFFLTLSICIAGVEIVKGSTGALQFSACKELWLGRS